MDVLHSVGNDAQFPCCSIGEVYDPVAGIWSPVAHLYDDLPAVGGIGDPQLGAERQRPVGAGETVAVVCLAAAHSAPMQAVAVVGCLAVDALLGKPHGARQEEEQAHPQDPP